jgi:hypothetical protein
MSAEAPAGVSAWQDALTGFERFYDALEDAVCEGDADAVLALVEARGDAIAELQRGLNGEQLPPPEAARLASREAETTAMLERFSGEILAQLVESRQHRSAMARYAEAERGAATAEDSR